MAINWGLVSDIKFDPVGSFMEGRKLGDDQRIKDERKVKLAEYVADAAAKGHPINYSGLAAKLLAGGDTEAGGQFLRLAETQAERDEGRRRFDLTFGAGRTDAAASQGIQKSQLQLQQEAAARAAAIEKAKLAGAVPPEGFQPDPVKPGAMRAVPGGPNDPVYLGQKKAAVPPDPPAGYRVPLTVPPGTQNPPLEAIPGGPQDPPVVQKLAEAKRIEEEEAARRSAKALQVKQEAERINDIREDADKARALLPGIANVKILRQGATTGPGFGRVASFFGAGKNPALDSAATEMSLGMAAQMKGALSDRDVKIVTGAVPGGSMDDENADIILRVWEAAAQRKLARSKFYEVYLMTNGSLTGADSQWDAFVNKYSIVSQGKSGNILVNKDNISNFNEFIKAPGKNEARAPGTTPPPSDTKTGEVPRILLERDYKALPKGARYFDLRSGVEKIKAE